MVLCYALLYIRIIAQMINPIIIQPAMRPPVIGHELPVGNMGLDSSGRCVGLSAGTEVVGLGVGTSKVRSAPFS